MTDIQSIRKIGTKIKEMRISYLKIQNVQVNTYVFIMFIQYALMICMCILYQMMTR
jgi:hypothetical protein